MNNAELIKALRYCGNFEDRDGCDEECPYIDDLYCPQRIMCDAADALEAADEKIADYTAAIDALDDSNDAYIKENERLKKRIAELEAKCSRLESYNAELQRTIKSLQAQIPKRGEWISVKDRLPEPRFAREWYLVSLESGCVKTLAFESDRSEWWETGSPVTHWMPLPDAPEVVD